jgi:hypothetical protein
MGHKVSLTRISKPAASGAGFLREKPTACAISEHTRRIGAAGEAQAPACRSRACAPGLQRPGSHGRELRVPATLFSSMQVCNRIACVWQDMSPCLLRQNVHGLMVSVLGPFLNLGQGAAANGVLHHDKTVVRHPQHPCDILRGHCKRIRAQNYCEFAELLKGNAIVHTAR